MLKNIILITWRNILRQKASALINISGLAIGMTCSMLILMWVQHELSYDRFNKHADSVYRVVENQFYAGGEVFPVAVTPSALGPALKEQFPEILKSARLTFWGWTIRYGNNLFSESGVLADPDIFEILTLPFIKGSPETALSQPNSIVISKEMADKFFGDEEPMGKTLQAIGFGDFVVSGVMSNIPKNSHITFDYIVPFVFLGEVGFSLDDWSSNSFYTYVRLPENVAFENVNEKIFDFIKRNREESSTEIFLQPLTEIHLHSSGKFTADIGGHGDIFYVKVFSIIALFVLFIACINFMNLATARSEKRAKEVGLRKAIGAYRLQIIGQFFGEAIFLAILSFLIALVLTESLLPTFNDLSGKTLTLVGLGPFVLVGFLGIALFSGLVSGSYPALYLSSFRPAEALKPGASKQKGGILLRKSLVVVQFTLSVIMIIGTLIVSRQIDYIRTKNLGLEKENLLYIWMDGEFREKHQIAKAELLKNPNIASVTTTSQLPTYVASSSSGWEWDGKSTEDAVLMHHASVDHDYIETFRMEMAKGRFYSPELSTDSSAVVVNETAVEKMGMASPIGKRLSIGSSDFRIVGVVKDFHFKPIRTKIEPMVLMLRPDRYRVMVIRIQPDSIEETVGFIEGVYKEFNSDTPFSPNFLDQRLERMYRTEQRIGELSRYFALIAIFISCLGLYGLASYVAERRTKEIGIRKVLGATVPAIFVLMSREFIFLGAVANLIAWPLAYYAMEGWLENYAYHASMGVMLFVLSTLIALGIMLITICFQAIKAALTNPANSLRYE